MAFIKEKHNFIIIVIIALQFIAGALGLLFRGRVFDMLTLHNAVIMTIILYAICSGCFQIIMICMDILHNYVRGKITANLFYKKWCDSFPNKIFSNFINDAQSFCENYTKTYPQIVNLELQIIAKTTAVVCIYVAIIYKAIHSTFFWGLCYIPLLSLLGPLSSFYKEDVFASSIKNIVRSQVSLAQWVVSYFKGFREIYFNWNLEKKNDWPKKVASDHQNILLKNNKIIFLRSLSSFSMLDFPYIICQTITILSACYGKITIGDAIVWWGLADFLVTASSNLRDIRIHHVSKRALLEQFSSVQKNIAIPDFNMISEQEHKNKEIQLIDKTKISLKTEPGIVLISAKNGSGKTTLLNTILGLNKNLYDWNSKTILEQREYFQNNIRVISKDAVIFENIKTIDEQIFGVNALINTPIRKEKIKENILACLSLNLAHWWANKLESFQGIISDRWSKVSHQELSSGEMVILSISRFWCHWNQNIKLVVVDESASPLDYETKIKFIDMLKELSVQRTVYFVTHEPYMQESFL